MVRERERVRERVAVARNRKPEVAEGIGIRGTEIWAVLENTKTGVKRYIRAKNLVTDAGDIYYAQRGANEAPTNTFNTLELSTATTPAPAKSHDRSSIASYIASTQKVVASGYPQTDDQDADNTGAGVDVVTHKFSYTKGDFNATGIAKGIITNPTPGANEPILTHFDFAAAFDKTADDTLVIYVNHTMNGV